MTSQYLNKALSYIQKQIDIANNNNDNKKEESLSSVYTSVYNLLNPNSSIAYVLKKETGKSPSVTEVNERENAIQSRFETTTQNLTYILEYPSGKKYIQGNLNTMKSKVIKLAKAWLYYDNGNVEEVSNGKFEFKYTDEEQNDKTFKIPSSWNNNPIASIADAKKYMKEQGFNYLMNSLSVKTSSETADFTYDKSSLGGVAMKPNDPTHTTYHETVKINVKLGAAFDPLTLNSTHPHADFDVTAIYVPYSMNFKSQAPATVRAKITQ